MVETVVSLGLAVDEKLVIKKNRLTSANINEKAKRICIITGLHGDELEGQYVCYKLIRKIKENIKYLNGIVDIYPSLNPLGIDSVHRGMPTFDLDMNRIFPGSESGAMAEHVAAKIIEDIEGADMCIDLHASNIFLREVPQVRVSEHIKDKLVPYAKLLNMDFIWVHPESTVLESTLTYSLNNKNIPTLLVEMGVGMRITQEYGDQLVEGIFNLMKKLDIWNGPVNPVRDPIISTEKEVKFINANSSGIFMPCVKHLDEIKREEKIGEIFNSLTGEIEEEVISSCDGVVFTLREYPVVYEGSLIARVLGGVK
ncbi:M14 family metallopeptidase [Clostridium beijerinckii]|uniref:M14 family metallopeptidase n=1 Tax=Clostridium beijerinckii TaxID=1520 RepID=UPI0013613FF7|nr:M14 family metallopeptidase [Clostridium beijerinckii]MZK53983.1 succinylglutamate desuccinylase [Clostridium beijerinckii]MZK62075.1 succinylglutamate desuccinylase [Clostridium beijerinckii]MZK72291.1 succinylglutamate desuccinylase [Clostridium beijerinckii]MZK77686.1 succinylglutamate desuccinylase [Clostridium beijerinckii]MZK87256.1 succinylglutamate desuccinylase [Clostridium beijerinckii]